MPSPYPTNRVTETVNAAKPVLRVVTLKGGDVAVVASGSNVVIHASDAAWMLKRGVVT
jgi:hypothetical protein